MARDDGLMRFGLCEYTRVQRSRLEQIEMVITYKVQMEGANDGPLGIAPALLLDDVATCPVPRPSNPRAGSLGRPGSLGWPSWVVASAPRTQHRE